MGKMASYSKRRITYNKVRLSLFLRSYGAYTIFGRFKTKPSYRVVSRLSNILNLDTLLLNKFFISGTYPKGLPNLNSLTKYLVPKERMLVYLEVEREIINLTLEKQDKEKTSLEDYDKAIMEPAIERVAGNHLKNIEDDKVFDAQLEELQRKYQNWYYATAYKYKLPTSRIIPFILRLIKN
ncbi:MAG: hypothetical protein AAB414_01250 [Patescibacteria group bacterium]